MNKKGLRIFLSKLNHIQKVNLEICATEDGRQPPRSFNKYIIPQIELRKQPQKYSFVFYFQSKLK